MSTVWTRKKVYKLLKLLEERPIIWNQQDPGYRCNETRLKELVQMGVQLGCSFIDVKKKIHNMRCTFRKQYLKIKNNYGLSSKFEPKWEYYDAMRFMYNSILNGEGGNSVVKSEEDSEDVLNGIGESVSLGNGVCESDVDSIESNTDDEVLQPTVFVPLEGRGGKRKRDKSKGNTAKRKKKQLNEDSVSVTEKNSDEMAFAKYISNELGKMPKDLRIVAKKKICDIIYEINMEMLQKLKR